MRTEINRALSQGYTARNSGLLEGMAGLAAPVFDRNGHVVGALSIGTHTARLNDERLPAVRDMLLREARALSSQINPFDPTLRHPMHALSTGDRTRSL